MLEEFELAHARETFAENFSTGMKKRLGLACALIHQPTVLVLDEPTNGLDPIGMRTFQEQLRAKAKAGCAVLLSTHLLTMAEHLCDRVVIIHQGRLLWVGTIDALRAEQRSNRSLEDLFLQLTEAPEAND
jgi:ABC-2 type transport system ATP-binding protein